MHTGVAESFLIYHKASSVNAIHLNGSAHFLVFYSVFIAIKYKRCIMFLTVSCAYPWFNVEIMFFYVIACCVGDKS